MKSEQTDILRIFLKVLVRVFLAVAALVGLAALCLGMMLSVVFHGPSETARDQLTLTLMASAKYQDVPVRFLGQEMVDYICYIPDVLPSTVSDPERIDLTADAHVNEMLTISGEGYTATVRILGKVPTLTGNGDYFAGFTTEGILVVAVSQENAQASGISGHCEKILMMNGKVNEGLMNAVSGWAPRVAIGQRADGTVIMVTTDGGSLSHPGATYQDLINIMTEQGAVNACLLSSGEE